MLLMPADAPPPRETAGAGERMGKVGRRETQTTAC